MATLKATAKNVKTIVNQSASAVSLATAISQHSQETRLMLDSIEINPTRKTAPIPNTAIVETVTKYDEGVKTDRKNVLEKCKKAGIKATGTTMSLKAKLDAHVKGQLGFEHYKASAVRGDVINQLKAYAGVKISGKTADLVERLERAKSGTLLPEDLKKGASVGAAVGVAYRQAQKAITQFRKDIGNKAWKEMVGDSGLKNIGWDNILQLALLIDDTYEFECEVITKLVDLATR